MSASHDCGADTAAYVLGALEPDEADRFRRHLLTCVVCQDEVDSFESLAQTLPMAAPQMQVSKELRARVLTDVKSDAKLRQRAVAAERRGTKGFSFGGLFTRPAYGGALALGLAVVALVGVEVGTHGNSSAAPASIFQSSIGDAKVRVVSGHGELVVHKLKQPAAGKIYEVWLKKGKAAPQPTKALFSVTSKGDGDVDIPGNVKGVTQVLVTEQPASQTQVPTGHPLIVTSLS